MPEIRHAPQAPTTWTYQIAGAMIDRHRHDEHQIVYVSSGVLDVQTPAGHWVTPSNRAVWLPAGTWHEHRFFGASSFHTVGFSSSERVIDTGSPAILSVSNLLRELLVAATDTSLTDPELRRIRAVLIDQCRRLPQLPVSLPTPQDPRLVDACAIVTQDLSSPRALNELAHACGASERTLARLFRTELGMTYPQWRNSVRVYQAMIDLAEGLTVTETAHHCGWSTPSAFIESFRLATGHTPRAYQRGAALRGS
jgi:AraC-like DNA-binding protein